MDEYYIGTHIEYSERELMRLEKEYDDAEEETVRQLIAEGFLDSFSDDESEIESTADIDDVESVSELQTDDSSLSISLTPEATVSIVANPITNVYNSDSESIEFLEESKDDITDETLSPLPLPLPSLSSSSNIANAADIYYSPPCVEITPLLQFGSSSSVVDDCENIVFSLRHIWYLILLSIICISQHRSANQSNSTSDVDIDALDDAIDLESLESFDNPCVVNYSYSMRTVSTHCIEPLSSDQSSSIVSSDSSHHIFGIHVAVGVLKLRNF